MIARIESYCLGVGFELALACDFRICSEDAQLGLPEIGLGMIPGSGGTQRLARLVGLSRAKDVIMRRKRLSAAEALEWGLVSEVVPAAELDVLDRVGGGDGFAAGLIYGLLAGETHEQAVRLGWAHGALLTTFPGDTTMATLEQVRAFAKGGSARIQR